MARRVLRVAACLAVVGLCWASSGCAFTKMETARQLDEGEFVVSGSADWPGFLVFIPRLQGNVTYGYGPGDVSVHLGSAIFMYNAGLGKRLYLSEWLNLSLQADAMMMLPGMVPFDSSGERTLAMLTATPRLTTSADERRPFYAGVQSNIITVAMHHPNDGWEFEPREFMLLGGLVAGLDYLFEPTGIGFQLEVILYPFAYNQQDGLSHAAQAQGEMPFPMFGQLSLGGYFRPPREPERMEPSYDYWEESPPRRRRPPEDEPWEYEESEPEREEESEPEYDDRGVPIY